MTGGQTCALPIYYQIRISALGEQVAQRDGKLEALESRVVDLESELRDVLRASKHENHQLANRIADLVERHQEAAARIYELQPVAEKVPMLQAAVEEKDASLSERERELGNMRQDIETIASRPVTGPVFRQIGRASCGERV